MNAVYAGRCRTASAGFQAGRRQWKRPATDATKGSGALRPRTIVFLILASLAAVFVLAGLAGFFLAA